MLERFLTLESKAVIELIEKKSRFIATASPIEAEKDALEFIEVIRKEHRTANHNVFAYQIGERNEIQRFSDDKEPSGTAGFPAFEVLRTHELKNAIVVITRYFGGTLLGTGGLTRAYGRSAKEAVLAAKIIEKTLHKAVSVAVDYGISNKLQYELQKGGFKIKDTIYTEQVEFVVLVENIYLDKFVSNISNITNDMAKVCIKEFVYTSRLK